MGEYDVVVVGAGQAGPSVAAAHAAQGRRVALVEAEHLGGTCLNHGCRPTKALRAAARVAWQARRGHAYGVDVGEVRVDYPRVIGRVRSIIGATREGVEQWARSVDGMDLHEGPGRLDGRDGDRFRVVVGDEVLLAPQVYLDVGARAAVPPIDGLDDVAWVTEEGLLALDELPEHLVVVGGGYIGCEFAQMFARLGSRVTLLAGQGVLPREDDDVSAEARRVLAADGVQVRLGRATRVARRGEGRDDGAVVTVQAPGGNGAGGAGADEVAGSHLLLAVGRRPDTKDLGSRPWAWRPTSGASCRRTASTARRSTGCGPSGT